MADSIFVDSVHLIALNSLDDEWRASALSAAEALEPSQQFITSHGVLSEVLAHFCRSGVALRVELARRFLQMSADPQYTVIAHSPELMEDALNLYAGEFAESSLSLQDCVTIQIMREYRIASILTADQEFARAGFTPLLRRYI